MNQSRKCIVHGCSNHSRQGAFVGDLCSPCYAYLTTGNIGPTDSFLSTVNTDSVALNNARKLVSSLATELIDLTKERDLLKEQRDEALRLLGKWKDGQP